MENYIAHTAPGGMHAINVFVEKPFIPVPPDSDGGENWCPESFYLLQGLAA